ncbi:hypothetical protein CCH79_00003892 [Gambusia affinis]|uniref:Uncharacterized protein n=1 Tax=Gambusia affinis TaxID=33528 RepID=A0A315VAI9_GAMAF|nr:hypothetical protein CCH79_00003892 [Gambusia affinis]
MQQENLLEPKLTPQERLKLRMQKALNKQSKADKKAAQVKIQQQEHKRQEREGELRAMARKIRMKSCVFRERERREKERDEWERQYGRQSHSPSPSKHGREHSSHKSFEATVAKHEAAAGQVSQQVVARQPRSELVDATSLAYLGGWQHFLCLHSPECRAVLGQSSKFCAKSLAPAPTLALAPAPGAHRTDTELDRGTTTPVLHIRNFSVDTNDSSRTSRTENTKSG